MLLQLSWGSLLQALSRRNNSSGMLQERCRETTFPHCIGRLPPATPFQRFPVKSPDFQKDQQKTILEIQPGEQVVFPHPGEGTSPSPFHMTFPSSPSLFLLFLLPFLLMCSPVGDTSVPLLSALGHNKNPGNSPYTSSSPPCATN